MKEQIARDWAAQCRNPAISQAHGSLTMVKDHALNKSIAELQDEDLEHCCLGVLSWLAYKAGEVHAEKRGDMIFYDSAGEHVDLSGRVREWAGVSFPDPVTSEPRDGASGVARRTLIYLNDADKRTLPQIADVIDRDWEQF